MKKLIFILIAAAVLFPGCKKNNAAGFIDSTGVITGRDLRKCACCWGWIIEINNTSYKFDKIPVSSGIDLDNITYPTVVRVQWTTASGSCSGRLIEILSISR
jgi:hypothetical protein